MRWAHITPEQFRRSERKSIQYYPREYTIFIPRTCPEMSCVDRLQPSFQGYCPVVIDEPLSSDAVPHPRYHLD